MAPCRAGAALVLLVAAFAPVATVQADLPFDHRGGNAWWVQVHVDGATDVEARATGGDWHALEQKDWGDWAASFHIPEGSMVWFRAHAEGRVVESCAFTHPGGVEDCAFEETFDVDFHDVGGNAWWVQTTVRATAPLAGVDARIGGSGQWRGLEQQDWGDWATALALPDGAQVQFRATLQDGRQVASQTFADERPIEASGTWPREGSFVEYEVRHSSGSPAGFPRTSTEIDVRMVHTDGAWQAHCQGWREEHDHEGELASRTRIDTTAAIAPPRGPTGVSVGDEVRHNRLTTACTLADERSILEVEGRDATTLERQGEEVEAPAWRGEFTPVWHEHAVAQWHDQTGLLLQWGWAGRSGGHGGDLVRTDAPIGPADPAPRPPEQDAWPFEGSHVEYALRQDGEGVPDAEGTVRLVFDGGYWRGVCDAAQEDDAGRVHLAIEPWTGPDAAAGDEVRVDLPGIFLGCAALLRDAVVDGQGDRDTIRDGEHVTTRAWHAHEPPETEATYAAWWDMGPRLMLEWRTDGLWQDREGTLVGTDAPIG